jgi:hypothetical protein
MWWLPTGAEVIKDRKGRTLTFDDIILPEDHQVLVETKSTWTNDTISLN